MPAPPSTETSDSRREWAVVTGSSRGIGRAIALELAAAGTNVVVHGSAASRALADVRCEVEQRGVACQTVAADLATDEGRNSLLQLSVDAAVPDIWVNNAGVDVLTGAAAEWTFEKKLRALWEVDVVATVQLTREIGSRMKRRGAGAIVNIGWDQAATGMEGDSGEMFAAIKGAVAAFTRSAAKSLAPEVRVNCVAPGWIRTSWGDDASDYWQRRAVEESLAGRWGEAEDVARATRFLASPDAAFITGQIVNVNGGSTR